jgi:hypothetical protein
MTNQARSLAAIAATIVVAATVTPISDTPGSALQRGMRLTYASGGREQAPWAVDSIERDVSLAGRTGCARIYLRIRPDQPAPAPRVVCRGGDTLFTWTASTNEWRAERPLGADMRLAVRQPSGNTLDYSTAGLGDTTISGRSLSFVRTTIITLDAQGRPTRRLHERYSVPLATALGGVFEVPDSASAGGWREMQRFELVRVEAP